MKRLKQIFAKPLPDCHSKIRIIRDVGDTVKIRNLTVKKLPHEEGFRQPNTTEFIKRGNTFRVLNQQTAPFLAARFRLEVRTSRKSCCKRRRVNNNIPRQKTRLMPTTRETILQALLAVLQTVPATVLRGDVLPERVPAGGFVILRDGDPGEPEVTLSPLRYHWQHQAEVEVIVQDKDASLRAALFDVLVEQINGVLVADRTLGGSCDWIEPGAPAPTDLPVEGGQALKAAILPVTLIYTTTAPTG